MGEIEQSGLEVEPCSDPQVIPQPDANKYFLNAEALDKYSLHSPIQSESTQSGPSGARNQIWRKAFLVLAFITVFLIAAGLGAGLGAGLAVHHRSMHPSVSSASNPVVGSPVSNRPVIGSSVTNDPVVGNSVVGSSVVGSSVVDSPVVTATQSGKVITITSAPSIPYTMPSPVCPAADRSTYIATNTPTPTAGPELAIPNTSLAYEIFCYTNFIANPPILDLQTLTNVTSLHDCLNACALYSFQTKPIDFPAFACTGVAWAQDGGLLCWLKSNVTLASPNGTDIYPGIDGAVMVFA